MEKLENYEVLLNPLRFGGVDVPAGEIIQMEAHDAEFWLGKRWICKAGERELIEQKFVAEQAEEKLKVALAMAEEAKRQVEAASEMVKLTEAKETKKAKVKGG